MAFAPDMTICVDEALVLRNAQKFDSLAERVIQTAGQSSFSKADFDIGALLDIPHFNIELQNLNNEAAKCRSLRVMHLLSLERLQALLTTVEIIVQSASKLVLPSSAVNTNEENTAIITTALNASLAALHVMTSQIAQPLYTDETMEAVTAFIRYCFESLVQTSCNSAKSTRCRKVQDTSDSGSGDSGSENEDSGTERNISLICNKMYDCIGLLSELVYAQELTDTVILHMSSIGLSAFFTMTVEDLHFYAMKLITAIFIKYKHHRYDVLNDALTSLMKFSEEKNKMKLYRLNTGENTLMFTALFVQLMHAALDFPTGRISYPKQDSAQNQIFDNTQEACAAVYQMAFDFLKELVKRCCSNTAKAGLKAMFRTFIDDLLLMFNKPEWSGAELSLEVLCKVLICNLTNHNSHLSERLSCMDYLGVILARMRGAIVTCQGNQNALDDFVQQHFDNDNYTLAELQNLGIDLNSDERKIIFSQDIILNYLIMKTNNDTAMIWARNFIISHWYRETFVHKDLSSTPEGPKDLNNLSKAERTSSNKKRSSTGKENSKLAKLQRIQEWVFLKRIKYLQQFCEPGHVIPDVYVDYNGINLLSEYIACNSSFLKNFDKYVQLMLLALTESSILMRSRAVKSLTKIIEADPSILGRSDMQKAMQHCFLDRAIPVREAAIDLIGKYILLQPEFIEQYYNLLLSRILDAGISVRKRVISIFRDICVEHPQHPRVPEICLQIIQRVHDEEGVQKLVVQVFRKMWFTPVEEEPHLDSTPLLDKAMSIKNVVNLSLDMGMESLDELLAMVFRSEPQHRNEAPEVSSTVIAASQQIVDCLALKILKLEATSSLATLAQDSSENYVLCFITLQRFAVVYPKLLVKYALLLGPYLSIKCQTVGDYQIITSVAYIMEVTLPLTQNPSESLVATVEEDTMKVILQHDQRVVASCVSCLASIVKNITKNYELISDTFFTFYAYLQMFKCDYEKNPSPTELEKNRPLLQRALFSTGLFLRHFNFEDKTIFQNVEESSIDQIFEMLLYYAVQLDECLQICALKAIGLMCVQYHDYMLQNSLIRLYHQHLTSADSPMSTKLQVLRNIELYLKEEAKSALAQDKEWHKKAMEENLKYICDASSGMSSTIMQIYIKKILNCYIHDNVELRQAVSRVTEVVLEQGLLQPMQIIPFLIAMGTDTDQSISVAADQQLKEIVTKYPGFVPTNLLTGLWLSHNIQTILQQSSGIIKGYKMQQNVPKALNSMAYLVLHKTKQQRRAFVSAILKQFDDQMNTSLSQMRYLVDNLAYFPYKLQDEPLFIIHRIDIIVATCGNNALQSFEEDLRFNESLTPGVATVTDTEEHILQLIPKDNSALLKYATAFKGCLLLLQLKDHLMGKYGISNIKIARYSPSDPSKMYEKPLNQHSAAQLFEPEVTNEEPNSDSEKNKLLVKQYFEFKATMQKLEAEDSDDEDFR